MLFTKSNAARIVETAIKNIRWIKEFWKVCLVYVSGFRPKFISKKAFRKMFVDFRKESAQNVTLTRTANGQYFAVGKDATYELKLTEAGVECQCQDYLNQVESFRTGVCKHGYKLLGTLGYDSLSQYLVSR